MSDFWTTSDNENATQTDGQFEMGGGDMEPIPANTNLKAFIDEAAWDERMTDGEQEHFIALRWTVLEPHTYKNRKVFQKVRVENPEPKKADKAKRMLAAIDANAGGQLVSLGRKPTEQDLQQCLMSKPMGIKVQQWKIKAEESQDGQERSGNWVSAVMSLQQQTQAPQPQTPPAGEDDDIPF